MAINQDTIRLPKGAQDLIQSTRYITRTGSPLPPSRYRELQAPEGIGSYINEEGFPDASVSLSILFNLVYGPDASLAAQSLEQNIPDPRMRDRVIKDLMRAQEVIERTGEAVRSGQMDQKEQERVVSNVKATVRKYVNPYTKIGKTLDEGSRLMEENLTAMKKHQKQYEEFEKNLSKQEESFKATERRIAELDRKIKEADERPPNDKDRKEFAAEMRRRMEKLVEEKGFPSSRGSYESTSIKESDAAVQGVPSSVVKNVADALKEQGIYTPKVLAYAIATIKHETNNSFAPINEGYYVDERAGYEPGTTGRLEARKRGYSGGEDYYGRGYIQLTHDYNYKKYGDMLGIDLVNNPELAKDPKIAAKILALYFKEAGTANMVNKDKLIEARRTINPDKMGSVIAGMTKDFMKTIVPMAEAYEKESASQPMKTPKLPAIGDKKDEDKPYPSLFKDYIKPGVSSASGAVQDVFKRLLGSIDIIPDVYAGELPSRQLPGSFIQQPQMPKPYSSVTQDRSYALNSSRAPMTLKAPTPQVSIAKGLSRPSIGPSTPSFSTPARANASSISGRSVYIPAPQPAPKPAPRQTFVSTPQKSVRQVSGPASRSSGAYPVGNTKTGRILYSDGSIH